MNTVPCNYGKGVETAQRTSLLIRTRLTGWQASSEASLFSSRRSENSVRLLP